MKKIKLKSKELVTLRKKLKKELEVNGEQMKGLVELNKKHEQQKYKIDRLKQKGAKILHKVLLEQYKMDEFDISSNYELLDDETIELEVMNLWDDNFADPEALKNKLREDKKNKRGQWAEPLMFTGHAK